MEVSIEAWSASQAGKSREAANSLALPAFDNAMVLRFREIGSVDPFFRRGLTGIQKVLYFNNE
jgi:hypothetical protein